MTLSIKPLQLVLDDDPDRNGVGPVRGFLDCVVTDDDAAAVAMGRGTKRVSTPVYVPRAVWNNLLANGLRRPTGDSWPDGTLAHPVATKDP